ncbi:uncharacterized protein FSUBG_10015 [Fusarium subglutinans]|uniref:Uncharacterized protein n=1 Tax=Gibberella subglutinans TaxID=42677 RepID=A0A8H5UPG4_GIBSU|nr:uncharacterized protein FSUBG_10015 [Fusarium subglutinans]KAF5592969.1 hypothetical protein FSUBG_10015 [Fusarium subglutinans]
MSRQSSSRDHLRRSDYDSLDQSQEVENVEMQSLRPEGSLIIQNVSSSPSDSPMTIGFAVWLAIATSFLVLVEAVVFLPWLWFEDRKSEPWRWLMLSGRATQSITLMSVLIRWAIGTLAAITTSTAASIALEIHGVPMSAVAEVSIARFTNSGPQSLKKMLPGATFRPWLRILMICLFALVGASQFASTLLVSDLRGLTILSLKKNMTYGFNFGVINDSTSPDLRPLPIRRNHLEYWNRVPSQFEIFAEYSEPGESSEELDDTGTVLRAFLPISTKAQRESIQSFNGIARVIDTQGWALNHAEGYRFKLLADLSSIEDSELSFESETTNATWTLLNSSNSGPWAQQWNQVKLRDGVKTRDEYIQITLCLGPELTSEVEHLKITANTTSSLTEPDYKFDIRSNEYDTSDILRQLGAAEHAESESSREAPENDN